MTETASSACTDERISRLEQRVDRERKARLNVESLLETKSRELYRSKRQLVELTAELERRVEERTRKLVQTQESALELGEQIARSERERTKQLEWFEVALNSMLRGLSMFDANQRLIVCNKAYREIYNLPASLTRPGTPLAAIVRPGKAIQGQA